MLLFYTILVLSHTGLCSLASSYCQHVHEQFHYEVIQWFTEDRYNWQYTNTGKRAIWLPSELLVICAYESKWLLLS